MQRRARMPRKSPDLKPSKPGEDYRKVPLGDGRYSFFQTEHDDINLSHKYVQRVEEQINDASFQAEWRRYNNYNQIANEAYKRSMAREQSWVTRREAA